MSRHPFVAGHDDASLTRILQASRPSVRILDTAGRHPAEVLSAFGHLSGVVAMRYHAMLFAERAGVPLVPIAYAPKNLRWLAERRIAPVDPAAGAVGSALRRALSREAGLPASAEVLAS